MSDFSDDDNEDISSLTPLCFEIASFDGTSSHEVQYMGRVIPFSRPMFCSLQDKFDVNLSPIWNSNRPDSSNGVVVGVKNILTKQKLKILTPQNQMLHVNMGNKMIIHNKIRFGPTQLETHKQNVQEKRSAGTASSSYCVMCNKQPCEIFQADDGTMGMVKDIAQRHLEDYDVAMDTLKRTALELLNAEPQQISQSDGSFVERYHAPKCMLHYIDYLLSQTSPRATPAIIARPKTTNTSCIHCYMDPCILAQPMGRDILGMASIGYMQGRSNESIRHIAFRAYSDFLDIQGGLFLGHPMPLCILDCLTEKYPIVQENFVTKRVKSRFVDTVNLVKKEGRPLKVGYDFRRRIEYQLSNIHSSEMNIRQAFALQTARECFCVVCRQEPCVAFGSIGQHLIAKMDSFQEHQSECTSYAKLREHLFLLAKDQQSLQRWQKTNSVNRNTIPACFGHWFDAYYLLKLK